MANLRYYEEEKQRHPDLADAECKYCEAKVAIRKMAKYCKLKEPTIDWTSGNRYSSGNAKSIKLNYYNITWLLVAHEFAHCWHEQKYITPGQKIRRHGKQHRKLVDRAVRIIKKKNWQSGIILQKIQERSQRNTDLATQRQKITQAREQQRVEQRAKRLAEIEARRKQRTQQKEAQKMTPQFKIERYEKKVLAEAQAIKTLKTRMKRLETSIRKRQRRVAALNRAKNNLSRQIHTEPNAL